eukprot:1144217-Pelagomonas_calceolata.AAC.2
MSNSADARQTRLLHHTGFLGNTLYRNHADRCLRTPSLSSYLSPCIRKLDLQAQKGESDKLMSCLRPRGKTPGASRGKDHVTAHLLPGKGCKPLLRRVSGGLQCVAGHLVHVSGMSSLQSGPWQDACAPQCIRSSAPP